MAYNASYTADDVTNATVDGIVKFVIVVASFAALIALAFLLGWFMKKWRGR
jgi:hypothetical protein